MRCLMFLLLAGFTATLAATPSFAATPSDLMQDQVVVRDVWARASAGAAATGAIYLALTGGVQADRLMGVSTPVAAMADVHESTAEGGVMRMRPVAALPIPPGKTVTFAPGGYHIMLMALRHPLLAGQTFPLTLTFEHAGPMTVDVRVLAIGAEATPDHDHMRMK